MSAEEVAAEESEVKEETAFEDLTAARQRTVMQSFMMYNIEAFVDFSSEQNIDRFDYGNYKKVIRLAGPPAGVINKLTMVSGSTHFIEMKPHEISNFVPMIRIYKTLYDESGEIDKEIELQFPMRMDRSPGDENWRAGVAYRDKLLPRPVANILDQTTTSGVGIKSFDYQFIGSNPATVRNDVKAKLVLWFQNFSELLRVRYAADGTPYAYIDLFDRARKQKAGDPAPGSVAAEVPNLDVVDAAGLGIDMAAIARCDVGSVPAPRDTFNPIEFEIKAVVGWADMSSGGSSITNETIKEVGKNANYAFILTLIDHDFAFEDDGTFTLTLDYRARLSGLLTDQKSDVLNLESGINKEFDIGFGDSYWARIFGDKTAVNGTPAEITAALRWYIHIAQACCDDESTKKAKEALSVFNDQMRTFKYRMAITQLTHNKRLFWMTIDGKTLRAFAKKDPDESAVISADMLKSGTVTYDEANALASSLDTMKEGLLGKPVDQWKTVQDLPIEIGEENTNIAYLFLGDLVEWAALSALSGDASSSSWGPSITEKVKVLLGSLNIENPMNHREDIAISLADVPIAFETFKNFWFKKVIKPRRDSYPLMNFVRDLVNMAVNDAMNSPWLNNDKAKRQRLILRMASISLPSIEEEDPLEEWMENHYVPPLPSRMKYSDFRTVDLSVVTEMDPLTFRKSNVDPTNLFNYLVVFVENASLSYLSKSAVEESGLSRKEYDKHIGIHHFAFGEDRGILKTAKFSKTNQPYLREARYQSHRGYSPFDQLSSVYDVEITTFGAPFYYPGQYLWIEPRGLGFNTDPDYRVGSPDVGPGEDGTGGSIAFIMGLGGYHIITEVGGYLEDGKYETKIKCRYDNSGADRGERKGYGTDDESAKCPAVEPAGWWGALGL